MFFSDGNLEFGVYTAGSISLPTTPVSYYDIILDNYNNHRGDARVYLLDMGK